MPSETTPSVPTIRTRIFSRGTNMWIISTFVFTMLAASVLAYFRFLPMDPINAAVNGFLVATVYVGFRIFLAYRALKLLEKNNIET